MMTIMQHSNSNAGTRTKEASHERIVTADPSQRPRQATLKHLAHA